MSKRDYKVTAYIRESALFSETFRHWLFAAWAARVAVRKDFVVRIERIGL